jgi:hypothetical protein
MPPPSGDAAPPTSARRLTYVVRRRKLTSKVLESVVIKTSSRKRDLEADDDGGMGDLMGAMSTSENSGAAVKRARGEDVTASTTTIASSQVFRRIDTISSKDLASAPKPNNNKRGRSSSVEQASAVLETHTLIMNRVKIARRDGSSEQEVFDVIALDEKKGTKNLKVKTTTTTTPTITTAAAGVPVRKVTKILPPNIRVVDDALKKAFQTLNLSSLIPFLQDRQIIIAYGSSPSASDHQCSNGQGTAIHCAVYANDYSSLHTLLASRQSRLSDNGGHGSFGCGCNVNSLDGDGRTPADLAKILEHEKMYELLTTTFGGVEEKGEQENGEDVVYDVFEVSEGSDAVMADDADEGTGVFEVSGFFDSKTGDLVLDFDDLPKISKESLMMNDDDYDSNDENADGNDYPDEESGSDDEEEEDDDDKKFVYDGSSDSGDENNFRDRPVSYGQHSAPSGGAAAAGAAAGVGQYKFPQGSSTFSRSTTARGNGGDIVDYLDDDEYGIDSGDDDGDVGYGHNPTYYQAQGGIGRGGMDDDEHEQYAYDPEFDDVEP